jgi:hypothetical protein
MAPERQSSGRLGVGLLLVGTVAVAVQVGLAVGRDIGDQAAFTAGIAGAVACYLGSWLALRGTPRRLVAAGALVWSVGWIAVAPAATAGSRSIMYGGALSVGCLLSGVAGAVVHRRRSSSQARLLTVPEQLTGWRIFLVGGAFVGPSTVGLLVGPEAVTLTFVILAAVTVILLYLFRPAG